MDMATHEPLLDEERINELIEEIGEEDLGEVLLLFLDEAEGEVASIALGLDDDDHAKATHFLRSGGLNIGFAGLSNEAQRSADLPPGQRAKSGSALAGVLARSRAAVMARWH